MANKVGSTLNLTEVEKDILDDLILAMGRDPVDIDELLVMALGTIQELEGWCSGKQADAAMMSAASQFHGKPRD